MIPACLCVVGKSYRLRDSVFKVPDTPARIVRPNQYERWSFSPYPIRWWLVSADGCWVEDPFALVEEIK